MITTKKEFLKSEYDTHYNNIYKSLSEFTKYYSIGISQCVRCNTYYWLGCKKRCKCK